MSERICPTPGCGAPSLPGRRPCARCHKRAYRAAHPIRAIWHNLRHHAKERRIAVTIDFPIFENLCQQTGYHERRGNDADSLTIDRFDAAQGYEAHNTLIFDRTTDGEIQAWDKADTRESVMCASFDEVANNFVHDARNSVGEDALYEAMEAATLGRD